MKIGIVIAIARELNSFLGSDFKLETISKNSHEIYKTTINNNEIYVIKSGCGLIDASSAAQLLITGFNVELIINYGVTGALAKGLLVEDLFLVSKCVCYEYDVSPIDPVKPGQYEEFDDIYIPLSKKYFDYTKKLFPNLKEAVVASGNKFVDKLSDKTYLNTAFSCNICDMEIGAIARVCYLNSIDCLSIKCISDSLEGSGIDFNKNVNSSAQKAFNIIKELLFKI